MYAMSCIYCPFVEVRLRKDISISLYSGMKGEVTEGESKENEWNFFNKLPSFPAFAPY